MLKISRLIPNPKFGGQPKSNLLVLPNYFLFFTCSNIIENMF